MGPGEEEIQRLHDRRMERLAKDDAGIAALRAEVEAARRTAEYWKAEHNAANLQNAALHAEIAEVKAERDRHFRENLEGVSEKHKLLLQVGEMQKVIDAVSEWNDEIPALSNVEAKLVSAFVAYKNLTEKRKCEHDWELIKSHGPWPESNRCKKCGDSE
jgi:hypothetical protein